MNETAKKKVNYSVSEKSLLLSIVQRFKNVVENKKTDAVTWREKDSAWEKIAEIFSSKSTGVLRTKDSLRKLYENLKKNVRKQVVDEKKLLICTGGGPPPAKKPKAENDLKEQILSIVNSKTVYGLPSIFDGDAVKENRDKSPQPGCSKDFYQLDTDHDYFSFDNENEVIVVETSTPRKGILVNTDQNTEPQNNKYQKHESCQKFAATTNEDSIIMEKSSKDINIFKTKKDDALHVDSHVDGCSAWGSRRKPAMKETGGADLKREYSSLAKAKFELYSEELKLAKSRIKREEELHELNKESLNLEIEKKRLEIKRLQAFVVE